MSQVDAGQERGLGLRFAYAGVALLLGLTQGFGVNLIAVNLPAVQGALGATSTEGAWLLTAYYAVNVSSALLLVKFRYQYGFRLFADLGLGLFLLVTLAHFFASDLRSAIAVRAAQGFAAAPLSTLSLFYMFEAFPQSQRGMALALGVGCTQLALPLARLLGPHLIDIGQWRGLYLPELGLALMSVAAVNILHLTPIPRVRSFDKLDIVSFAVFAPALALLCIVLGQGRYVWWTDAPWLGVCLAVAVGLLAISIVIEMNRTHPMVDFRWLSRWDMARLAIALFLFRIVLSEQSIGAVGFLQAMGLTTDQTANLFWLVLPATAAGFIVAAFLAKPEWARIQGLIALLLIAAGAWIDSHVTRDTRIPQLYLSQALMAFAGALFLPSVMLAGIGRALRAGQAYIVSFFVLFSGGQALGALIGAAGLGSFVAVRQRFHLAQLAQNLTLADPAVAARARQLGGLYGHVLTDPALARAEGAALLVQQAGREAAVQAYGDVFRLIATLALATFALFLAVELVERRPWSPVRTAVADAR